MVRLCCFLDKSLTALGSPTEMSAGQGVVSGELNVLETGHGLYRLQQHVFAFGAGKTGSVSLADIYAKTGIDTYAKTGIDMYVKTGIDIYVKTGFDSWAKTGACPQLTFMYFDILHIIHSTL